jgi:hypothetical protein
MVISSNALALDGLAVVVAFGIGFLLWTLAHLFRESQPRNDAGQLFVVSHPRR